MNNININLTSEPNLQSQTSSKGNQLKLQYNGYWLKIDTYGYESLSEYIISRILQGSNIECVPYDIVTLNCNDIRHIACCSQDFKKPHTELVTLAKLFKAYGFDLVSKQFARLSTYDRINYVIEQTIQLTNLIDFPQYLANLLYIDRVFLNEDRHFNNISFLYNMEDNNFTFTPIFDNGAALLSDTTINYPLSEHISNLLKKVKAKPFNVSFEKQCEAMDKICKPNIQIHYEMPVIENHINSTPYSEIIKNRVCNLLRLRQRQVQQLNKEQTQTTNFFQ